MAEKMPRSGALITPRHTPDSNVPEEKCDDRAAALRLAITGWRA
jgi:hypothetical protein